MATYDSATYTAGVAPSGISGPFVVQSVYATYDIASALSQNDIIRFCRLPANATVIGGYVYGEDIDTGTEAFEFDVGIAANGVDAADPDAFGNFGVWTGDAITDLKPEAGNFRPLGGVLFSAGPKTFTVETTVQGTVVSAANAGGTGNIWVKIDYVVSNNTP